MSKLTQAQRELLIEVFNGEGRCVRSYKPAQKLVEFGLCEWHSDRDVLIVTDAGREALVLALTGVQQ